ncbi:MAG TPA: chloride channel protein [Anaeromyxobacteraceae bacterium]|nr:chloride channel protein [Anaeromyxobacteraceae bacterium]
MPDRSHGTLPATEPTAVSAPPVFYRSAREFLRQLPGTQQRFWILVVATGAISGTGAAALLELLELVREFSWGSATGTYLSNVEGASPLRRILVPALAGALITLVGLFYKRPIAGHGTAGIIEAIWAHKGRLALGRALVRGFLSIIAVGMGASLGREGALVSTGAASGSWLSDRLRLNPRQARLLVACGAASGIAAAYDVPIGGAIFGLEVLLGSFALELLGPIVVSCVTATIIARVLSPAHPGYEIPAYALLAPREVLVGLAMGPVLGVFSVMYVRVVSWVEVSFYRVPRRAARFMPPVGMAIVGAAAIMYPQLLGNGYDTVNAALLGHVAIPLLFALPFLKLAATALCAGVGIPGGLFTPSLFYGALIGGALGEIVQRVAPIDAPSGAFALIGMAGVLAGTTHAAVSSVLIIFELTGDYDVILPLMLSAAVAAATSRMIEPDSLYTAPLRRRGVKLPELPRPEWLRVTPVSGLMMRDAPRVPPELPFQQVILKLLALPRGSDLYVTDADGRLMGVLVLDALKGNIPDGGDLAMIVAADVMDSTLPPVTPNMTVSEVAVHFEETDLERLPVVDDDGRLIGSLSRRAVMKHGKF